MSDEAARHHPWRATTILLIGIFMTLLDVSIVNVALPSIQGALHASSSSLEWIISGYTLALGLLLIPAGRLGDNIGHKRTFIVGLSLFTLASLACALAQNPDEIIASRFIQGLGAGIYSPSIMAFIQLLFTGRGRSKAFAMFGAVVGIATSIGPLLGGLLVQVGGADFGWRLVFLVNVPIALIVLPLAVSWLPLGKSQKQTTHRLDPVGIIGVAVGLLLILFPLVEGRSYGWPWWTWACFVVAAVIFGLLWIYEKHLEQKGREPLLATHVLTRPAFAFGSAMGLMYFASFTSIFFALAILWQEGYHNTALASGLMITPFSIGNLISSSQSHNLSHWFGRYILLAGTILMLVGMSLILFVLHTQDGSFSAWLLAGPLFIAGVANGIFIAPNQDFTLRSVPPHDAGSASGMFNTAQRVGTSVGIAAVGTVLFSNISVGPDHNIAKAFTHGTEIAIALNIALVIATLVLVVAFLMFTRRTERRATNVTPA